ncbi:hypothetical protein [Acinetobacter guillouiae]|uniref:hypothetical protein n=1 Tax=Acinetobacter guillouiae TaxID=106649 RepID=UPI002E1DBAE9
MAGGSQIIINKDGIKIITPAKFEVKAGQHLFKTGEKVPMEFPFLERQPICESCLKEAADQGAFFVPV